MDEESEERLLKILSNPIRATIVRNLYKDKLSFTHLMQITECKTGQLSFHLKKLEYLVEQDELKRYKLSDKGIEDVETILPHLSKVEHNVPEKENEVGFALKLFVESLVHLISCCIFSVKSFLTRSYKYLVEICSRGSGYLKNRIAKSSSHFGIIKIFWQRATDNMRLFSKRLSKMTNETVKSLKSLVIVIVKSTKRSMNPMFSYSLIVIGLMLFVPAAFLSINPQFDSLSNSGTQVNRPYISIDQMDQANQLYEKELFPGQQHYQSGGYNSTLHDYNNYINKFGYPITPETIDTWRNEKAKRRIQYIEDSIFAALSISSVMMLIGVLLAYKKKMLLNRVLLSTVTASILLLLASVIVLINMHAGILANFNQNNIAISSVTHLTKNFIELLLLITFSSSGLLVYLKTMKMKQLSQFDA